MTKKHMVGLAAFGAAMGLGLLTACDISSSNSATRNVPIIVEGFYSRADGSPIVSRTSGANVNNLNLRQSGDQLEAIDNNGVVFRGTIGQVIENTRASFTMEGRSTAGNRATLAGNFDVRGNVSVMTGSWIEDMLVGQITATALVPTNAPPDEPGDVAVSPTSSNLQVGQSATFTASGGSGSFTWSLANASLADLVPSGDRNATLTLTARVAGNTTLTVRDSAASPGSASATIAITAVIDDGGDDESSLTATGITTGGSTPATGGGTTTTNLPPTPGQ